MLKSIAVLHKVFYEIWRENRIFVGLKMTLKKQERYERGKEEHAGIRRE
jgi:hypothetical protein